MVKVSVQCLFLRKQQLIRPRSLFSSGPFSSLHSVRTVSALIWLALLHTAANDQAKYYKIYWLTNKKSRQCVVRQLCDYITPVIRIWRILVLQLLHVCVVHLSKVWVQLILLLNNDELNWSKVTFTLLQILFQTSAILYLNFLFIEE